MWYLHNSLNYLLEHLLMSSQQYCKGNKHVFGRLADYTKLMVNSNTPFTVAHPQVRSLISLINKAQVEKNCKTLTTISKPATNISKKTLLRNRKCSEYSVDKCINAAKYCTCACPPKPPCCIGRHSYHEETEIAVNQQILAELNAGYAYLSMACFFGRTEIALPGCHGFFMKMHDEEHEHALIFIDYQLMRGGHVKLCPLTVPECQNWQGIQKALSVAVEMEKLVKEKLVALYNVAEKHHDLHAMDLITTKFMDEQERSICEMSRLLMRAAHMGSCGVAEYLFDKEVHTAFVKKSSKNKSTGDDKEDKSNLYI